MRGSYLSAICMACFPIDQLPCHLSIYGCELDPYLVIGQTRKIKQFPPPPKKKKKNPRRRNWTLDTTCQVKSIRILKEKPKELNFKIKIWLFNE